MGLEKKHTYRPVVSKLRPARQIRPGSHFIRPTKTFCQQCKIIYLRNICWFGWISAGLTIVANVAIATGPALLGARGLL